MSLLLVYARKSISRFFLGFCKWFGDSTHWIVLLSKICLVVKMCKIVSNCPDPSPQTQVMRKTFTELWCSTVIVWRGLHTFCRGWQSANGKWRGMKICWRCRRVEGGCSIQGGSPCINLLSAMLSMRSLRIWGSLLLPLHFTGKIFSPLQYILMKMAFLPSWRTI